jgi:tetratricopeptide (TPR) repeat protein/nucleoside-triphosphatase THEP1
VNRANRKSLLTAREKVLLHLLASQRFSQDPDAPRAVTQDGIAEAVAIGRNNVAKIVTELADAQSVDIGSRHVKGLPSIRRVYFLSQKGFNEALALKQEVETTPVTVIDLEGREHRDEVARLNVYLPKRYTFLELASGVQRGRFDCPSFHEGKVKEERRFVDYTDRKPTVRSFYGRQKELQGLSAFVASDHSRVMVVHGIPGIGKTTLVAKYAQDLREQSNVFWHKIHEWVDLKALLRALAEFLSQVGKKGLEWYLAQVETPGISEVAQLLETELSEVSAVLIIDDVQKADKGVAEFLKALLVVLDRTPGVRLICTSREIPTFYSRGQVVSGLVEEISLEGLDRESSYRMMRARSLPDHLLPEIYSVTSGHPLFMELVDDPQRALGKNIRMFIEQEVASKLEVAERRILDIASVFRYPVPAEGLFVMDEEMAKGEGEGAAQDGCAVDYDTIEALTNKSLLTESLGRMIGMHDVFREFFYSRLAPRQRGAYHRSASKYYLQDASPASLVEALYHSLSAHEGATATSIAVGHGRDIIARGYATPLEPLLGVLLERSPDMTARDKMEVCHLRGEILEMQGEWDRALEHYAQVLATASPERDRKTIAEESRRIGVIMLRRNRYDEARTHLEEARRAAEGLDDRHLLTLVYYDLGGVAEKEGDTDQAVALFERSRDVARSVGDDVGMGKALYGMGRIRGEMLDLGGAITAKKEALSALERTGEADETAKVLMSLGSDLRNAGRMEEAIRALERSVQLADGVGNLNTQMHALFNAGSMYIETGQLDKAEEALDQIAPISQKLNDKVMVAAVHLYRGYLYHYRRSWEWAKDEFRISLDMLRSSDSPHRLGNWLYEIGVLYIENSDFGEALTLLNEALRIADEKGIENLRHQVDEAIRSIPKAKKQV